MRWRRRVVSSVRLLISTLLRRPRDGLLPIRDKCERRHAAPPGHMHNVVDPRDARNRVSGRCPQPCPSAIPLAKSILTVGGGVPLKKALSSSSVWMTNSPACSGPPKCPCISVENGRPARRHDATDLELANLIRAHTFSLENSRNPGPSRSAGKTRASAARRYSAEGLVAKVTTCGHLRHACRPSSSATSGTFLRSQTDWKLLRHRR